MGTTINILRYIVHLLHFNIRYFYTKLKMKYFFLIVAVLTARIQANAIVKDKELAANNQTLTWEDISWNLDGDDKYLSDGDHIVLETTCDNPSIPEGHVRFGMICAVTWWKSITVHEGSHFMYELIAIQDEPGDEKFADVDYINLELYNYVLSKAKTFGVHTDMYKISNAAEMKPGCQYLFKWLED